MSISLTMPDLLRQIQADKVDADIYARCQDADRLRLRDEYDAALDAIKTAVDLATRSGVALDIGVAFLYLAAIRHATPRKDAQDQAPRDAETAVNWLRRDAHHVLIAHLVCALIYADDGKARAALRHDREAQTLAAQLSAFWHRRNDKTKEDYYQDVQGGIMATVRDLQTRSAAATEATDGESITGASAISGGEAIAGGDSPALQLEITNPTQQFTLNYYEISRVWINGREYLVESVNPIDPDRPGLRLLPDQKYIAVPDPDSDQPQQYVLVKEGGQPTAGQIVVNVDPVRLRAWTNADESIGDYQSLHIMGTVEARLRPAPSKEAEPEAETEIDEDLLDCVDAFTAAANARRRPDPGLTAMHRKFLSYLRRTYNLQVIPITPRKTRFNPQAGHHAVEARANRQVPDGVILEVRRNGYTRDGKVVREAYVVVNQK